MKKVFMIIGLAAAFASQAADYTLDFRAATPVASEAPVLRRAEMAANVGTVPAVAVGDTLNLKLFGDVDFVLNIVSAPPAGIAGQSFIAKDANGSASAIVKVGEKSARISVDDFMNRRQYTVRCKDGKVLIVERDNSQVDDGECGTCGGEIEMPQPVVEETTATSTTKSRKLLGASGDAFPIATQKSVVDILVAFDQGAVARSATLGYETIEDFADYAVGKMNTVLANSQLDDQFCYRLVGVIEIDGSWSTINNELLLSMRAREGAFAKLSQLRDKFGADTITLLINRTSGNTSGIGFEYSGNAGKTIEYFNNMDYSCNVCDINTVHSRYTMSHETGHNMGCGHSNRQVGNAGPGRYSDSCGYHFTDVNSVHRATIMAYTYTNEEGDNNYYNPIPYFSTPEISPEEYGCALGKEEVNNNRGTLLQTHADIAGLRDRVLPYDWDVRFLDDNGNDIADSGLFYTSCNVTLTNANPEAEIYYTLDGSTPTSESFHGGSGTKVYMYLVTGPKTLTACAVVDGKAQSVRSITLYDGHTWSGDANGNGLWLNNDNSVLPWNGKSYYSGDAVMFSDLAGVSSATVAVKGTVAPSSVSFSAINTAYTFDKGDDAAQITIPDANFAPTGDLTFNVPVQLSATTFTNMTGCALTFNAPFGQTVNEDGGTFNGMINIGPNGTLTVAPGSGKTQTIEKLNNVGWYAGTSTFRVGEGKVVFSGAINGGAGVIGRTKLEVANGGELVFNMGGGTGHQMNQTSLTVEKGGVVRYNDMEHLRRTLLLNGGTIYSKRLDLMGNPGVYVTDDASIENAGSGYILIRNSDSEINVSDGKALTLNVGTKTDGRNDTSGWGIIKRGGGALVANVELKHSGKTIVSNGTFTVGYSSSQAFGGGWELSNGANLTVKEGCGLLIPSLSMESGAELTLPIAESAPLTVNDTLNLAGVNLQLIGDDNYVGGDRFTVVTADEGIDNADSLNVIDMPTLAEGLKWEFETSEKSIVAFVKDYGALEKELPLVSNNSSIAITFPNDAELGNNGGVVIGSKPLLIDGISTKAVSITLDVEIPEEELDSEATICSWKIGNAIARCVRRPDQKLGNTLDCYHGDGTDHIDNSADSTALQAGRHMITIAYYSYDNNTNGGTFVYVDNRLVYRGPGLRWSNDSVNRITVGATAHDSAMYGYNGLKIHGIAVIDATSTHPVRGMTASGGVISYDYMAKGYPSVFANTPDGSFMLNDSILRGTLGSEQYDSASVSAFAACPADATGVVFGLCLIDDFNQLTTIQAEYVGNGKFMLRSNDSDYTIESESLNIDVSVPHLYTMVYDGSTVMLWVNGNKILETEWYSGQVCYEVDFGCGYWNDWSGNGKDNPNPIAGLKVYASHIALGTSDRAVSEDAVMASMATDEEEDDDPEPPETPATIDVLVAYDNGAQTYVSNKGVTLAEFAQTQIGKMNDVLVTNRLDRFYSYRLAGVCKVDGTYTNIDTAPGLIAAGEGPAVSLRAAREIYGADTVTLLVDTTSNTIGNSSPLNSPDNVASQHECAFSVCSIRAVDTGKQHTMIHENAHNMGCGHARAQGIINSPFEYGRGFYFKDGNVTRHTIMAYGGDNDASWYFSTTSKEFGFVLGDATNNNARVLKETCGEVAKWREGAAIDLDGSFATGGAVWQTGRKYPWSVEGNVIRSFNQTDYTYQCTTPLKATIEGPKVLSFKHKSYFGGENVADSNYSHFDVLLDDSPVLTQTECTNSWTDAFVVIPDGTHEVTFVFSQRFAMNNSGDYKDGTPEADDAVWLKDIALIDLPHSSTSDEVAWTFPVDATRVPESYVDGLIIGNAGIVNTLEFDGTNAVVASVLAELPDGVRGEIAGCAVYRPPNFNDGNKTFYAFAYSNGDGTFSLGHGTTTDYVTSTADKVSNWTGLHVWTFAFAAQTGARLYCDGVEIASTGGIKWSDTVITNIVTFCDDPRGDWALTGAKVYAVHSDFGSEAFSNATNTPASNASVIFEQFKDLSDYANQSMETKLALLRIYKDTGSVIGKAASECVLRISEIMPKPTDALNRGALEGMDVNGLESGWVEVENTSDQWADLADYKFIRSNRGKKTGQADYGNFPSVLIAPHGRAIFYTSERYSNSADMSVSAWATPDEGGVKPKIYTDLGNILVWPDKVNPKKSPFVRLIHTPSGFIADTVVVPSDVPEGYSIIVGEVKESLPTERWLCPTPTRGKANAKTDGLTRIGPNVGPLYENKTVDKKGKEVVGAKHDSANEFARVAPPAKSGEAYEITFSFNPVMSPTEAAGFRDEDEISSITLVYRAGLAGAENEVAVDMDTDNFDPVDWGHTYKAEIPADKLPGAGQLVQWKFRATDASGNEWTSPSFNNPDDGYEWYGTIVEAPELESATLPTWHMFADSESLEQMDVDASDQTLANNARVAIYDSSTSNYYDYVRIDLRGNTSAKFTKKSHGLRFAKAHPLTMTDIVTGETIEEIRKTSLISEFADPSYMRQMIAFWLWKKMGNLVPFDFPVRCNLNGEFYQLAFNSERFTDELIEDVYELDKYGYSYKNVGWLESDASTTAGGIEKKTPDDEKEDDLSVLTSELTSNLISLNGDKLTEFVVEKFDLPAWINYLASARITQEMDDVWANLCIYYDNAQMHAAGGVRGTDTWKPLGYDFNLSLGQWYYNDSKNQLDRFGLMSNQDWYKSHPLYGGRTIRAYRCEAYYNNNYDKMNGNYGYEAVLQSPKFRRLFLRRLRTLMDQELKAPGTLEGATPFMFEMRKLANLMRDDARLDVVWRQNDTKYTDSAIDVWGDNRPEDMDAGIDDIWENYVVPRRQHLYVTHSITNTSWAVGYASDKNAGIPEAQSPFEALAVNITVDYSNLDHGVIVISNGNDEVVDMSGWTLKTGTEKKEAWTLPAGTVCDSNDCIYVVADRRKYISDHADELTDQVIVGNATFGTSIPEEPLTYPETETSSGTVSISEEPVVFSAANDDEAAAWVESLTPQLTEEQIADKLTADKFTVVAKEVPGEPGKYQAVVDLNPVTVEKPEVDTSLEEPVEIEEYTEDPDKKKVSVSISNAIKGLWYGYEVSDELGESAAFTNDVDSFERATGSAHKVKGSPRDKSKTSGFFRLKVLPAKPSKTSE